MAGMAGQQAVGLLGVNILRMYVSGVFGIHLPVVRRQAKPFSKDKWTFKCFPRVSEALTLKPQQTFINFENMKPHIHCVLSCSRVQQLYHTACISQIIQ
jgi:hypothetical protein